jgi:hypothetical protein
MSLLLSLSAFIRFVLSYLNIHCLHVYTYLKNLSINILLLYVVHVEMPQPLLNRLQTLRR